MPSEQSEPRELTPIQKFWGNDGVIKDFSPHIEKSTLLDDLKEDSDKEVEEAITPAPKASSAPVSATSSESPSAPLESGMPALPDGVTPTEALEAAVKESGKDSDESEDEPLQPQTTTPPPAPSSPSSSTPATSPGSDEPPAGPKPPTVPQTPTP